MTETEPSPPVTAPTTATSCAVKVRGFNYLNFLNEPPDSDEDLEIVEVGAWVELPFTIYAWSPNGPEPTPVLCRSRRDPARYKYYRFRNQPDWEEWEDTGLEFGGTFSKSSWAAFHERHMQSYTEALACFSEADGVER